ncbi:alpha/beta hydrolase (plasmid) [Photobacterium sp. DA100]|uniref:alpha/beta fold hydrolase n=1 Tax=Photobacterium sp. DA100 TaxID=3027472 RepID=UPI002478DCB0|nr:alpha/beta hydrolase [Photobacterium sp. DA100]WEM45718.1 alpha/beta hydrolase [Photobacterium sp. DA100]
MRFHTNQQLTKFIAIFLTLFTLSGCELVQWKKQHDHDQLYAQGYQEHLLNLEEGGQLKYWIGGTGKPLLLIHGFGGNAVSTWKEEMLELSKHYQVIAPDLAWFGESYSMGTPNLTTQTETIWQLLDALKIDKINVAGISYGGFITYNMMMQADRVEKSVIIASPGPLFSDADLEELCRRAGVEKPEQLFVPTNRDEVRRLFDNVFYEPKKMPDFVAEQIYSSYFSPYKKEKEVLIQSLVEDRNRISLADTATFPPSMLIWGDSDQIFPLKNGLALSQHLNSAIVVLPETAHGVTNEQPNTVTKLLKIFIS